MCVQDVFVVLTDRMHKSAFKCHCQIIGSMFRLLLSGRLAPLFDPAAAPPGMTNPRFVCEALGAFIATQLPHVAPARIPSFLVGIQGVVADDAALKAHVRDFLIEMKEFAVRRFCVCVCVCEGEFVL